MVGPGRKQFNGVSAAARTIPGGGAPWSDTGRRRSERRGIAGIVETGDNHREHDRAKLLTVDLILTPAFLEDVWNDRELYEVAGVPVEVVSRRGLLKMKRIAGRPQDLADVDHLEKGDDAT